jgi:hypothetical protein
MRVVEGRRHRVEWHFTEGEPDLEAPEELAIGELDDETILEDDLDNEDVLEQDVDEDVLEVTLEDLVHGADQDEQDEEQDPSPGSEVALSPVSTDGVRGGDLDDFDDELDDDVEESLDLVLFERLDLVEVAFRAGDDGDGDSRADNTFGWLTAPDGPMDTIDVAPCRIDEFVCQSCFLVRKRVQLADAVALTCRDCSA